MPFYSGRRFQIWDYNVGHSQMLLRSPISDAAETNIDIVFLGVEYLGIPSKLVGVGLMPAERNHAKKIERLMGRPIDRRSIHVLISGGKEYLLVAAGYFVSRNHLDLFESSLEYASNGGKKRELGEILARSSDRLETVKES